MMRRFCLTLMLGLAATTGAFAQATDGAPLGDGAPATVDQALSQLSLLESRIVAARKLQSAEAARLKQAGQSLDATSATLKARAQTGAGALQYLDQYRVERGTAMIDAQAEARREQTAAREATEKMRSASGLMAWEIMRGQSDPASLAALAMIEKSHSDRARVASARALRSEGAGSAAAGDLARVAAGAGYYSAFEQYSLSDLRRRQQALVDQVSALQRAAAVNAGQLENLSSRREELNALVKRLSSPAGPEASPPAAVPAMPPELAPANALPRAVVDDHPSLPGVPDEDRSEPIPSVSLEAMGGPAASPEPAEAGARRLFWHATPVVVQAVAAGKVVFSGAFAGYRHLLIVDLGGGWHLLYGNLSDCLVKEGDSLTAGETTGSYQADFAGKAEPFWLEIRRGVDAVAPETCPLIPADWQSRLFMRP